MAAKSRSLFDGPILRRAIVDSFRKLDPRVQIRNPVMFVVFVGSILTTVLYIAAVCGYLEPGAVSATTHFGARFILGVTLWLWFTVLFANFAEAMAEGRGKAQADTLRKSRKDTPARKLAEARKDAKVSQVSAATLRRGDIVLCEAGEFVPADGEVVEGVASVDESAITGESAPVIRESGGDRSSVTGGTRVLSDWLVIRIGVNPGEAFLDRMISMVEGAKRQKTPNEIALNILLASFTIVCLLATATLLPYSIFAVKAAGQGVPVTVTILCALLVCLIPTTIGGLLSAIGIAGMDRMIQANVIAMSGRAVEAAGDVDVLLLDKTGTITLGNRQAVAFHPAEGVSEAEIADAAQLSSLADETPEGRLGGGAGEGSLQNPGAGDGRGTLCSVYGADTHVGRGCGGSGNPEGGGVCDPGVCSGGGRGVSAGGEGDGGRNLEERGNAAGGCGAEWQPGARAWDD